MLWEAKLLGTYLNICLDEVLISSVYTPLAVKGPLDLWYMSLSLCNFKHQYTELLASEVRMPVGVSGTFLKSC